LNQNCGQIVILTRPKKSHLKTAIRLRSIFPCIRIEIRMSSHLFVIYKEFHDNRNICYHIEFSTYIYHIFFIFLSYSFYLIVITVFILFNSLNFSYFPILYLLLNLYYKFYDFIKLRCNFWFRWIQVQMQVYTIQNSFARHCFMLDFKETAWWKPGIHVNLRFISKN